MDAVVILLVLVLLEVMWIRQKLVDPDRKQREVFMREYTDSDDLEDLVKAWTGSKEEGRAQEYSDGERG